uniref:Pr1-like protein n=1 Tax=Oryza sativa subsp. japonica TaxID=39947 RepID=Q6YZ21_ORYSJ|nr:hypothetical protein [Oryza sativa Japonica Group]BAD01454.1 hypothetical protein [Oryza sativa Japonica Group]
MWNRGEGVRGPGPRGWWAPRGSPSVHGGPGAPKGSPAGAVGPTRQLHQTARAADGRAPRDGHTACPEAATSARPAGGGARAPMVATGDHRHGGAEAERGEGRGKGGGGPRLTPRRRRRWPEWREAVVRLGLTGSTVSDRNGGVDEGGEDAAKPREAAPRREEVRATTAADQSSAAAAAERESGADSIPARKEGGEWQKRWRGRRKRRIRREEGDDGWAPPVSEGGGRARPSAARTRGGRGGRVGRGKRRERGRELGRIRPKRGGRGF